MTNNASIIRLLVAKDWQLFQKQLALYVLAGIVALCLLALAKPWAFYLGSLMLIVVVVAAACFSISASLMVERKEHTLAFVMSLPVSPWDFTIAKLLGNLVTFGVPFLVLCLGTLGTVLFTPLPDGLFVYALLIFGYVLFAYSVALSIAMTVESEGWNTFVTGPMNGIKDGIAPLSGVIETDWSPYSFTMNWRFTRPGKCPECRGGLISQPRFRAPRAAEDAED